MYRYQPPQRPEAKEQALYESLARGELNSLADRHMPLPDNMSTRGNIGETVRGLSKVLLGYYDARWGLDGSMRGRW